MLTNEELKFALNSGIISLQNIEEQINMNIKKTYLEKHTHAIWESSDGKWWCTYLPDETKPKNRALYRRATKQEIESIVIAYWKEQDENPTIDEVFNEWNDLRLNRKQIKKSTHSRNQDIFKRFFGSMAKNRIKNVSELDWEDFLCDCIVNYRLTSKAFSNLKTVCRGMLKRAKKRCLISMDVERFFLELDVSDHDFMKRVVVDEKEVFYDDEIEKIMSFIMEDQSPKNMAVALMFVTGIRVGELVALKHEDFCGTTFQVKRTETRYRKDEHHYEYHVDEFPKTPAGYRTVFIPTSQSWIIERLNNMNPYGDYIFLDDNGNRMSTDMVRQRIKLICRHVGIPERSPHKVRKTYGSILLDNNIDKKLIESQMGHTDILCTEQYYHRNRRRNEQKQKIFDSIPEINLSGDKNTTCNHHQYAQT